MYINGKFVQGKAKQNIKISNPATEEVIDEVWQGTEADVNIAVKAAKTALPNWKRVPGMEKAAMIHHAATKMREHHDELAELLTKEEGKPWVESDEEIWPSRTRCDGQVALISCGDARDRQRSPSRDWSLA